MKKQSKASERELSKEIVNLSDGEFKALAIKMLTDLSEFCQKIKKKKEGYPKWNKAECSGNLQWQKGNQDSMQRSGTKEKNKHPSKRSNNNSKKWRDSYKPLGQPETFQYLNYRGARRREKPRNWKLSWTNNEGKLPQFGGGNRLLGSPGSPESPKEVGPKEEHTKASHH